MPDRLASTGEARLPSVRRRARDCGACGSCDLARRDFVRMGLGAAVVALLPRGAAAAPIEWISPSGVEDELRYPIPETDGAHVDRGNEVILMRHDGAIAAFALSCPHQRSMLRWREKDGIFQCTKHHSQYTPTGEFMKGRATRNMDRLAIRLDGDAVVVDPARVYHSDEDATGWDGALVTIPDPERDHGEQ